jgi:hypothetical protein
MKKFIALSAALVVLAGAGFAQLTVTGEANVALGHQAVLDKDPGADQAGPAFGRNGGDASQMKLNVAGAADKVGFRFQLAFNVNQSTASPEISDWAEVWIKPIDMLKIDAGRFNIDTLRGQIGDGGLVNYTVISGGNDDIFSRFKGENALALSLTPPIPGLFIGAQIKNVPQWASENTSERASAFSTKYWGAATKKDDYQDIQIAAGYTIEGVGLVRVQYIGADPINFEFKGTDDSTKYKITPTTQKFEAAFAYTGMSGLTLDVGAKIPLSHKKDITGDKKDDTYQPPFQASVGAQYVMGALTVPVRIDTKFLGKMETSDKGDGSEPFILNAHLWPSYKIFENTTVGVDFGIEWIGKTELDSKMVDPNKYDGGARIGFGAWLEQSYGPGSVKVGLAYRVKGEVDDSKEPAVFTIPVIFKAAF